MRRGIRQQALVGVTGFIVLSTMGLVVPARAAAAPRLTIQHDPAAPRPDSARRPFAHQRHEALPCRGCHGAGATHRVTYVRAPRDCAACHHDPQRGLACASCHSRDALPEQRTVRLELALQVTPAPLRRDVAFRHSVHVTAAAGLRCTDCHTAPVTLARGVECGSCHASHHGGRAECAQCHVAPARGSLSHDAAVHLSCSGGPCHAATKAPLPTAAREVCLFCHDDRRGHEPDGTCAVCHRIPGPRAPAGTEGALRHSARAP